MGTYILFVLLAFIVTFTFFGKESSALSVGIRFFFGIFIIFICFLACTVFGPNLYVDYKGCMRSKESNVSSDIDLYELYQQGKYYTGYAYDAPHLCIERKGFHNNCTDDGYGDKYRKIEVNKVKFTGRVIKMYSFNAFTSNFYKLELKIDGKRYWINDYEYNDIRFGYTNRDRIYKDFKVGICMPWEIRDIDIP